MNPELGVRSETMDRIVLGGWVVLMLLGQCVFRVEVEALEWLAAAWLLAGVFLVRKTACLPLVLMTCPAFMCEIQRRWAWVQVAVVAGLLLRILVEERFSFTQYLKWTAVGGGVLFFSWPVHAMDLLRELRHESWRALFDEGFHPEAAWAIFPFRQAADRTLVAGVCAAAVLRGGYISTGRLWNALRLVVILSIVATVAASVLPWQAGHDHRFLGTTNHGTDGLILFPGAGTNLCYVTFVLAAGMAYLFVPIRGRWSGSLLGVFILLLPTLFVRELAYYLAIAMVLALGAAFAAFALATHRRRAKLISRVAAPARLRVPPWLLAAASLAAVAGWYLKMGVLDESSTLRVQWRETVVSVIRHGEARRDAPATQAQATAVQQAVSSPVSPNLSGKGNLKQRIKEWMRRRDPARAPMWFLGWRHSWDHGFWKGEGAGTWARFHRSQPRPYRAYFAHMHNTYLDLIFEYGVVPMAIVFLACLAGLLRILLSGTASRLWIFYLAGMSAAALGQDLLYAFTGLCLLIPAFVILPRALFKR